ncbi:MAG TPA: DUF2651 family protein [Clostridiales bacterium]|nr:DUF2651 family protein [Clostridiales bacterium]
MEFIMALFIFPLVSFVFGIIGQRLIKKMYIVVGITFLGWLIATYTIFNGTFLIWVFIYSFLSLIGATIVYLVQKSRNK